MNILFGVLLHFFISIIYSYIPAFSLADMHSLSLSLTHIIAKYTSTSNRLKYINGIRIMQALATLFNYVRFTIETNNIFRIKIMELM